MKTKLLGLVLLLVFVTGSCQQQQNDASTLINPVCTPSLQPVVRDNGYLRFKMEPSEVDYRTVNTFMQIFLDKTIPCNGFLAKWHVKMTSNNVQGVHLLVLRKKGKQNLGDVYKIVLDTFINDFNIDSLTSWTSIANNDTNPEHFVETGDVLAVAYDANPQASVLVRNLFPDKTTKNTIVIDLGSKLVTELGGLVVVNAFSNQLASRLAFLDADVTAWPGQSNNYRQPAQPAQPAQQAHSITSEALAQSNF